jgi:serine/threonine protein kinase
MFSVDPGNHDVVVEKFPKPNETFVSEKTHKKYRLLSILGSGGYGTVFEATDETR